MYDVQGNKEKYKKDLNVGEIGCYLSHVKAWQKIVDEKLDYAIILEDDFKLSPLFNRYDELLRQLKNWDYIRLADLSGTALVEKQIVLHDNHNLVSFTKVPINTLAQAVSYQGAKKLLESFSSIARPIDVDLQHYWEMGIQLQGIQPALVPERSDFESEITKLG